MEQSGIFGILLIREWVTLEMQGLRDHFLFQWSFLETPEYADQRQEELMPSICLDMYPKVKADLLSDMSVWSCGLLVWPLEQMAAEGRKRNIRFRLTISSVNGEVGIGRDVQAYSLYAKAFKVAFTLVIFFSFAAENPSELLCFCVLFGYSGWASFECFG